MSRLENVTVQRLKGYIATHPKEEVYFLIDDSILEKTGKDMEFAGWYFDHSAGRYVWGYNIVSIMAVVGNLACKLSFRLYIKKNQATKEFPFKSKIELAKELVSFLKENNLRGTIVFDAWYGSDGFLNWLEENSWVYVTRLKSNRLVETVPGLKNVCSLRRSRRCCLNRFSARNRHYTTWQKTINLPKSGKQKLVVCRDEKSNEKHYIISNKPIAWRKILTAFNVRWQIETAYRDSKQELGLESFQVRSITGVIRAIFLSLLTQTIAAFALVHSVTTGVADTIGELCQAVRNGALFRLLKKAHSLAKKGYNYTASLRKIFSETFIKTAKL